MHAMQSGHSSLESAFVRILHLFRENPPDGPNGHADLINRVGRAVGSRPSVIAPELVKAANETRQFRHVAVRAHDDFDLDRAERAVGFAALLAERLTEAIISLPRATDP